MEPTAWRSPPTDCAPPTTATSRDGSSPKEEWERINRILDRPLGTLNCQHFATPIVLGVSKPVYSRKELSDINKRSTERIEYKGQKMSRYEASQRQRQMETAIRYAKDERDAMVAAGDKLGATQAGRNRQR